MTTRTLLELILAVDPDYFGRDAPPEYSFSRARFLNTPGRGAYDGTIYPVESYVRVDGSPMDTGYWPAHRQDIATVEYAAYMFDLLP